MSHGYASSIHKSQGATVDKTFVLASKGMDSKLSYVSMSRQREDVKMYANKTEFRSAGHLKNGLARDGGREAFKSVLAAGERQEKGQDQAEFKGVGKGEDRGADKGER
ncbi:conjugative transfer protein TraA, partial [mine drainage metagenome]